MTCGVYEIVNKVNGKRYVGSSVNIERRFKTHIRELNKGTHHASHLQNSFRIHGEQSYELNILKECDPEKLIAEEQLEMNKGFDYNSSPTAGSALGFKHSPETRIRQSKERINRYKRCPKFREHIMKISKMPKSESWKESARRRLTGIPKSRKHSENMAISRAEICETRVYMVRKLRESGMMLKDIPSKVNLSWSQCQRICAGYRYEWAYGYEGSVLSETQYKEAIRKVRSRPIDKTIYLFRHPEHGDIKCTQWELKKKFPDLISSKVSQLCSKKQKTHKGWKIEGPE